METMRENYDTLIHQIKLHHQTELGKLQPHAVPETARGSPESADKTVALKVVQNLRKTDKTIRLSAMFKCDIEKGAKLCVSGGNVAGKYYSLHSDYHALTGCQAAIVFEKYTNSKGSKGNGMHMYVLLDIKD